MALTTAALARECTKGPRWLLLVGNECCKQHRR